MKMTTEVEAMVTWWNNGYGIANEAEQDYLIHKDNLVVNTYKPQNKDRIIFETTDSQPNVARDIKKVTTTPKTTRADDDEEDFTTPPRGVVKADAPTPGGEAVQQEPPKTTPLYDDSTDEEF